MDKVCTKCGAPIGDGEKFCTACGTPVPVQKIESTRYCTQCGNLLKPNAKFCEICGKAAPVPKPKKEVKEDLGPATMDELMIPEITDATFSNSRELRNERFDGFEAAEMPVMPNSGEAPKPVAPAPAPSFSMDSADAPAAPAPKPAPKPAPAPTPILQQNTYSQPQQNFSAPPQQSFNAAPQQNFNAAPQQNYNSPLNNSSTPKEKLSRGSNNMLVPIILIIAIIAVIIVDIILFSGKLKDKDDGAENEISIVYNVEDIYGSAADD